VLPRTVDDKDLDRIEEEDMAPSEPEDDGCDDSDHRSDTDSESDEGSDSSMDDSEDEDSDWDSLDDY
jgi:hypothetical protein